MVSSPSTNITLHTISHHPRLRPEPVRITGSRALKCPPQLVWTADIHLFYFAQLCLAFSYGLEVHVQKLKSHGALPKDSRDVRILDERFQGAPVSDVSVLPSQESVDGDWIAFWSALGVPSGSENTASSTAHTALLERYNVSSSQLHLKASQPSVSSQGI